MFNIRKTKFSKIGQLSAGLVLLFAALIFSQTACNNGNTSSKEDTLSNTNTTGFADAENASDSSAKSLLSGNVPSGVFHA